MSARPRRTRPPCICPTRAAEAAATDAAFRAIRVELTRLEVNSRTARQRLMEAEAAVERAVDGATDGTRVFAQMMARDCRSLAAQVRRQLEGGLP